MLLLLDEWESCAIVRDELILRGWYFAFMEYFILLSKFKEWLKEIKHTRSNRIFIYL